MRSSVLALHIAAGIAGLISGAAAIIFRKGSERHRMYGNIFVISMLTLGLSAAYLAISNGESGNLIGGVFTVYMVGTAWVRSASVRSAPVRFAPASVAPTSFAW